MWDGVGCRQTANQPGVMTFPERTCRQTVFWVVKMFSVTSLCCHSFSRSPPCFFFFSALHLYCLLSELAGGG